MSSGSSGRYQSKLFNFVHNQTRRFTEQCDRALRHVQIATVWSVQALLYPVYRLFESTQSPEKQLYSKAENLPQLPTDAQPENPPTVDTPIQRVLMVAVPFEEATVTPAKEKNALFNTEVLSGVSKRWRFRFFEFLRFKFLNKNPDNSITHSSSEAEALRRSRPVVRGIATQLSNRSLVLVTIQNEVLDVFTLQHQQKLQQRIVGEVANYWRYRRLASAEEELNLPAASDETPQQVIAWVQTGTVAIALLDRTVADWESSSFLAPATNAAIAVLQRSSQLLEVVKNRLTTKDSPEKAVEHDSTQNHTLKIQALIRDAIAYFFGDPFGLRLRYRGIKHINETKSTLSLHLPTTSKPPTKQLRDRSRSNFKLPSRPEITSDADPWLSESDLFGDLELQPTTARSLAPECGTNIAPAQLSPKTALPSRDESRANPHSLKQRAIARLQRILPKQASGLVERLDQTSSVTESQPRKKAIARSSAPSGLMERLDQTSSVTESQPRKKSARVSSKPKSIPSARSLSPAFQNAGEFSARTPLSPSTSPPTLPASSTPPETTQIKPSPDWIETKATAVGYVKHPLEQLLGWLDRAMLWLENVLASIVRWVQRLLRGK